MITSTPIIRIKSEEDSSRYKEATETQTDENLEDTNFNFNLDKMKSILHLKLFSNSTSNKNPILSMLWNIRSINDNKLRKLTEIINYLTIKKVRMDENVKKDVKMVQIDWLVITEFGKKDSKFNPFNIQGYKLFTALRIDKKGGGIGIYVNNCHSAHIKYKEVAKDYEFLLIEIWRPSDSRINVLGIYRPPIGSKQAFCMKLEEILLRHDENLIIMGDTNINCNEKCDSTYKEFMNILDCYNYKIINSAPTRFNAITGNHSMIDQIITRNIKEHRMQM